MKNENEVTALVATLEKCRELSGCPAGVDLQDHLRQLAAERDAALNAERTWETAMMEVCGEDGPASVASEIRSLQALRDTAMQALKSQVEQLATENVGLRAGRKFFMYSDDSGFETFETQEEAVKAAQEMIDDCREDAYDGWPEEADTIRWGVVMQQATEADFQKPSPENGWVGSSDYRLLPEGIDTASSCVNYEDYAALAVENAALKAAFNKPDAWLSWHSIPSTYQEPDRGGEYLTVHEQPGEKNDDGSDSWAVYRKPDIETPATDRIYAGIKAEAKSHDLNAFISHYSAELDAHIESGGDQFDAKSVRLRSFIVGGRMFREKLRDEEKALALREVSK